MDEIKVFLEAQKELLFKEAEEAAINQDLDAMGYCVEEIEGIDDMLLIAEKFA